MIELTKLKEWILKGLQTDETQKTPELLLKKIFENDKEFYNDYLSLVDSDLEVDYMQKFFQYYLADRENLGQDYTPKSLSKLLAKLTNSKKVIDVCCGSGALTIQQWVEDKEKSFELYEFDERVIPFLLFNLIVRNIDAKVYHCDVLTKEVFKTYIVKKSEKFGEVTKNDNSNI